MNRRRFLGAAGGVAAVGWWSRRFGDLSSVGPGLPQPPHASVADLTLRATPGRAMVGSTSLDAWLYNGLLPGPTLRVQRGERARIRLENQLPESTITHWHGLLVPEAADGHPRLAIDAGKTYEYAFTVDQPPGLSWYHPHTHLRTGYQVHRGLAGLIVIDDPANRTRGLPPTERELVLVIQDRTVMASGEVPYELRGPAMMAGYFGDTILANGTPTPTQAVDAATYRLRILNGSASRIYRLALTAPATMRIIGTDGGFLRAPVDADEIMLAPAERLDLLVDFSASAGRQVSLETRPFTLPQGTFGPGGMGRGREMMRGRQGDPGVIMSFDVGRTTDRSPSVQLDARPTVPLPRGAHERRFVFSSMMMDHTINGMSFDKERADVRARAGAVERWTFVNDGPVPHPVHLHAAQFQVRTRTGGRNTVSPSETGWKDTVLVAPSEVVTVDVHFGPHPGLFLLHCHNLVHEDMGMMLNVALDSA